MSRRTFAIVAGSFLVALALAVAFAAARGIPGTVGAAGGLSRSPRHVRVSSSWARGYADLHELKAGAVAIVLGTVTSGRQLAVSSFGPGTPTMEYQIHVERALKGSVPATVSVRQIGGTTADGAVVVEDTEDPALAVGERGVFFLFTSDATYYTLLDGGMGHFAITAGTVNQRGAFAASPAAIAAGRSPVASIHGAAEADFIAQVLAA